MGALLKYLLLALVVLWLLYSPAVRGRLRGQPRHKADGGKPTKGTQSAKSAKPDRIEPCAHCGVHLPVSEALHDIGGLVYCSEAHRLAGPRN